MDLSKEPQQRKEFCDILYELASNQELLKDENICSNMYMRLEALYYAPDKEEAFRHFYSDIFMVLVQIQQADNCGSIDILGENLRVIRSGYKPLNLDANGNLIDVSDSIRKLYDHVSLDIARILYSDARDRETSGKEAISEIQSQLNQIRSETDKSIEAQKDVEAELARQQEALSEQQDNLANQQREYIAILGIFAAVVLAFTGGIVFSTSVLENINAVSPYRIIIVALIIGLVLVNILFGLFYYIGTLVNGKSEKQTKPLWITNGIFLLLLVIIVIGWCCGAVEHRNERITAPKPAITNEQDASQATPIVAEQSTPPSTTDEP